MTEKLYTKTPRGPNGEKDPNDWAKAGQAHVIHEAVEQAESKGASKKTVVPSRASLIPTEEEIAVASLTPKCIVDQLLYADVAQIVAPGGTGKTTILLHVAIRIALGESVFGLRAVNPGWTLIVTAEDQRERLLARKREIMARMALTPEERAKILQSVLVWDVTGEGLKLTEARDGNLQMTSLADEIGDAYQDDPPALIVFDPLVSFGVSEQAVNDNEQALVTAARRMVRRLDTCVLVIHHTGKANARSGSLDQYAGRGGSALADGSRMTFVLQGWKPGEGGSLRPPPSLSVDRESSITILARPKLSYAPPNLPLIWIKRTGYAYEHHLDLEVSAEDARQARADQIERFLSSELALGKRYTQRSLEDSLERLGMTKAQLRSAISDLEVNGRLSHRELPANLRHGARRTYLHPSYCAEPATEAGAMGQEG